MSKKEVNTLHPLSKQPSLSEYSTSIWPYSLALRPCKTQCPSPAQPISNSHTAGYVMDKKICVYNIMNRTPLFDPSRAFCIATKLEQLGPLFRTPKYCIEDQWLLNPCMFLILPARLPVYINGRIYTTLLLQ